MTSQEVSLRDLIAPSFYDVHWDIWENKHTFYDLDGGRMSTKSSFVSLEIVLGIVNDPLANAIIYRKVGDTLSTSVYEQIQWAIDALHLNNMFESTLSPLRITYKATGQRIIFKGLDKAKKSKSIKCKHGYFKYLWFEELDEFAGMEEIRSVQQSIMRGGIKYFVFRTYNPPISQNHWVNQEALNKYPDTLHHHSDYRSVPREWLGEEAIKEAEKLKETKPNAYKHEYLGIPVGTGGQVFSNIKLRCITKEERSQFDHIRQGLDWGFAKDPFAYVKCHYDRMRRKLYIFQEIYQVGLTNINSAKLVIKANPLNQQIICDSAEPKSIMDYKELGIRIKGAKKGPDSVEYGIKFLQDLDEIVIDDTTCPNTAREFVSYELIEDGNGGFKAGYPDKDNHSIDAVRYALNDDMPRKGMTKLGG